MVVLEIAAANQHKNAATLVIERYNRALQILGLRLVNRRAAELCPLKIRRVIRVSLMIVAGVLFGTIEISTQRIFRHFLQIGVDGGANAKPFVHRPVPSDGRDHLLTNVINRVTLALRILTAADDNIFRLRARAFLAVDESKIAHPAERVIACFARSG